MRVLIIEDDETMQDVLKEIVKSLGHVVLPIASNASDAYQTIQCEWVDLIMSDIHIEGEIDGIETVSMIQKQKNIPVVFMVGFMGSSTQSRLKEIKNHTVIYKPFDLQSLIFSISRYST